MVLVNYLHKRFEFVLSLQPQLLWFSTFFSLLVKNDLLWGVTLVKLVSLNFSCYQISLNPIQHVLVLVLLHLLICAFFGYLLHLGFGRHDVWGLTVDVILHWKLFILLLLKLSLESFKLLLLKIDIPSNLVELLPQLFHCNWHLLLFFTAALPTRNNVVWL